jgi:hypothetical protein
MLERFLLVAAACLLGACSNSQPPLPSPDWTAGPIINGVNYSSGVVMAGDVFTFPSGPPGVHYVTRYAKESAREKVAMRFAIEASEGVKFLEVDSGLAEPGPGKLRLYLQRCGDDWSSAKASYRFWSAPVDLAAGEYSLVVWLTAANWTNVWGQQDAAGFAALLTELCNIGFTFGGQFAGHGAYATGPARFILKEYSLQ